MRNLFGTLLLPAIFLATFASCKQDPKVQVTLDMVNSYIEQYPDSALYTLQSIVPSKLTTREARAKHSLLLSMAIDKNYIDTTDFSILQPAIDWYTGHGTATDKLRMYYYKGRIHSNRNNYEAAMEAYVNGLDKGAGSDDYLTRARMLYAKGRMHYDLRNFNDYIACMKEAAHFFEKGGNQNSMFNSYINVYYGYSSKRDSTNACKELNHLKEILDTTQSTQAGKYFEALVNFCSDYKSDSLAYVLPDYLRKVPASKISWMSIAAAYLTMKEYNNGINALASYTALGGKKNIRYNAIHSKLHEGAGNSDSALKYYKLYFLESDSTNVAKIKQETQFIEKKYYLELDKQKETNSKRAAILIFVIISISLFAIILFLRHKYILSQKEKALIQEQTEKLQILYEQIRYEKESLSETLSLNTTLDKEIQNAIKKRIELLNQILVMEITGNYSKNNLVWNNINTIINDKESFMNTTRLSFKASNPNFISFLKEKNLSEYEIGYCCLYAIGLKGKEIGSYTKNGRHYNISSNIRAKLGLSSNETNLSIYIRQLLK